MAKLLDMNGAEIAAAMVKIANQLKHFMDDEEFSEAFKKATRTGVDSGAKDLLTVYVDIVPLLFGEKHLQDTLSILAVIEGKTVKEMLKMNGTELIADALRAYKEQLIPFFTQLGLSVGTTQ